MASSNSCNLQNIKGKREDRIPLIWEIRSKADWLNSPMLFFFFFFKERGKMRGTFGFLCFKQGRKTPITMQAFDKGPNATETDKLLP